MPELAADVARVSLFAGLAEDQLANLADSAHSRRLARGQILFSEGEPSDCSSYDPDGCGSFSPLGAGRN